MKADRLSLLVIRDAVGSILKYTSSGEEHFRNDLLTQDAVARNVVVVGGALRKLRERFRTRHRDVPWEHITSVCDAVSNRCFESHLDLIWSAVEDDLPALLKAARAEIGD